MIDEEFLKAEVMELDHPLTKLGHCPPVVGYVITFHGHSAPV